MPRKLLLLLLVAPSLLACGSDAGETETPTSAAATSSSASTGAGGSGGGGEGGGEPVACGTAKRDLPDGLVEIAMDDGVASSNVRDAGFEITVNNTTYKLGEEVLNEQVRFELPHPAKIYGFSVQWAGLPEGVDPKTELSAGLYPDFGYNGFDYWEPEPYWTGSRCAEDVADGDFLTYVFDEPIAIDTPGLVYVAHRISGPESPVFSFDAAVSGAGDCALWDDCRSAMNLPDAQKSQFYNGISFPIPYNFLVRLYVEYTDDVAPEETFFQKAADFASSHVSWGDYDSDGFDDMLLSGPLLYKNAGDGTFTDETAASGIAAIGASATGGVFGDYDNDGCLDLFLYAESYQAPDTLLRSNCDGTFSDATPLSGIVDQQSYNNCGDPANVRSPSAAAAWLDIDADGKLDLYLSNFICWSNYTYYTDTVFLNNGDGTFSDVTASAGFSPLKTASRGAAPIDYDGDGDVDLFVNNYVLQANLLFKNNGDGTVTESAKALGAAGHPISGYYGHTIGAAWGDLDGDGDFDLIAANLAHPRFYDFSDKTQVLIQDASGSFDDITGTWDKPVSAAGLRYQETHSVPALGDFDADGALDLIITAVYDGRPTDFYWGNGDGTFALDAYHAGITTKNGWGVSLADYDNDGDLDAFATDLFRNDLSDSEKGHWLSVRAIGNVSSNWGAIGATVQVTAGNTSVIRHVEGGSGKGGQDSQYLVFGLGTATSVDTITVTFPGPITKTFTGPFAADQRIWVYEDGTTFLGWAP